MESPKSNTRGQSRELAAPHNAILPAGRRARPGRISGRGERARGRGQGPLAGLEGGACAVRRHTVTVWRVCPLHPWVLELDSFGPGRSVLRHAVAVAPWNAHFCPFKARPRAFTPRPVVHPESFRREACAAAYPRGVPLPSRRGTSPRPA